jgi:hypothetical protein
MITDELLFRFLNKETSGKENRLVNDWLSRYPDQAKRLDHLKGIFESQDSPVSEEDTAHDWNAIEPRLSAKPTDLRTHTTMPVRLARIAAVILTLFETKICTPGPSSFRMVRRSTLGPDRNWFMAGNL